MGLDIFSHMFYGVIVGKNVNDDKILYSLGVIPPNEEFDWDNSEEIIDGMHIPNTAYTIRLIGCSFSYLIVYYTYSIISTRGFNSDEIEHSQSPPTDMEVSEFSEFLQEHNIISTPRIINILDFSC